MVVIVERKKKYRFRTFLWDCFMVCMTGGLWLIWVWKRR